MIKKTQQKTKISKFSKTFKVVVGSVTTLITIAGIGWGANQYLNRYALAEELNNLKQQYITDKQYQRLEKIQERMWLFQKEFGINLEKASSFSKDEYNRLKLEKDQLEFELKKK